MTSTRTRRSVGLGTLHELELPAPVAALPGDHHAYASRVSGCNVIAGHEPARQAPGGIWLPDGALMLWHLSISHPDRYPTWDEIADARYKLIPDDVTMALLLPPAGDYVNEHETCFHLWQIDDRRQA